MNSVSHDGWFQQVMWLWFVHLLHGDFQACSHQFVVKSGFHLYSLFTHTSYISQSLPTIHTWHWQNWIMHTAGELENFWCPPKMKTTALFLPTDSNVCTVSHIGFTHCLILFKNTFKYVPSVLKDASSELYLETTQCFQSFACTPVRSFFFFGNRQLDFNSWIFILCALEKKIKLAHKTHAIMSITAIRQCW